eukprot:4401754-Pleurochrysis_carterae.AAC.1
MGAKLPGLDVGGGLNGATVGVQEMKGDNEVRHPRGKTVWGRERTLQAQGRSSRHQAHVCTSAFASTRAHTHPDPSLARSLGCRHAHARTRTHAHTHTRAHKRMRAPARAHARTHACTRTHACWMHTHTSRHARVPMPARQRIYARTPTRTHAHTHMLKRTCTRTHRRTRSPASGPRLSLDEPAAVVASHPFHGNEDRLHVGHRDGAAAGRLFRRRRLQQPRRHLHLVLHARRGAILLVQHRVQTLGFL